MVSKKPLRVFEPIFAPKGLGPRGPWRVFGVYKCSLKIWLHKNLSPGPKGLRPYQGGPIFVTIFPLHPRGVKTTPLYPPLRPLTPLG
jgi:hypothetical protein